MISRKTGQILLASVLESLEPRLLFSTVTGTSFDDHIIVKMSAGVASWSIDDGTTWTSAGGAVDTLTVNAGDGNDTIEIDSLDACSLIINGGLGNDMIQLNDVSGVTGSVHANGYDDTRPGTGSWFGDASSFLIIGDDTIPSGYGDDSLFVGNDSLGGDVSEFPDINWDDGDPQYEADGNIYYDEGGEDVVVVNDRNDSDNAIWTVDGDIPSSDLGASVGYSSDAGSFLIGSVTGFDYNFDGTGISNPGLVLKSGSGSDSIELIQGGGYSIDAGVGDDTVAIDSQGAYNADDLYAINRDSILGGDGDDLFEIGTIDGAYSASSSETLYGINDISLYGGNGNDTVVVDDSQFDSTSDYWTGEVNSGQQYEIHNSEILVGYSAEGWLSRITDATDIEQTNLYTQAKNGRNDAHVHPIVTVEAGTPYAPVAVYLGSILTDGTYDYNVVNVNGYDGTPLHITPSQGSDQITVGDGSGDPGDAKVTIDGSSPIGSLVINSDGELVVAGNDLSWTSLGAPTVYGGGIIDVDSGTMTLDSAGQDIGALQIGADGTAVIDVGQDNAIGMSSLTIASGGVLDMTDCEAVLDSGGSVATWLADIRTYLHNGQIITSTTTPTRTRVGYGDATTLGLSGTWGGVSIDSTSVLIKFTYAGDANLDGQVDITDMDIVAAHWNQSPAVWTDGDFDYNDVVSVADLVLVTQNYQADAGVGDPL